MRRSLGTAVFSGMLGVTIFGIFLTPVFFYVILGIEETKIFASVAIQRFVSCLMGGLLGAAVGYLFGKLQVVALPGAAIFGAGAGCLAALTVFEIQRRSRPTQQGPSVSPPYSVSNVLPNGAPPQTCPHCGQSLTTTEVEGGQCSYCYKRVTDPVEPKQPRPPFLAVFLLGLLGALAGTASAIFLLGENHASWTTSLCGGVGFAIGSAAAKLLFNNRRADPPKGQDR